MQAKCLYFSLLVLLSLSSVAVPLPIALCDATAQRILVVAFPNSPVGIFQLADVRTERIYNIASQEFLNIESLIYESDGATVLIKMIPQLQKKDSCEIHSLRVDRE